VGPTPATSHRSIGGTARADIIAGLVSSAVAIPLAMAFGMRPVGVAATLRRNGNPRFCTKCIDRRVIPAKVALFGKIEIASFGCWVSRAVNNTGLCVRFNFTADTQQPPVAAVCGGLGECLRIRTAK
jgi:hypothetical protein